MNIHANAKLGQKVPRNQLKRYPPGWNVEFVDRDSIWKPAPHVNVRSWIPVVVTRGLSLVLPPDEPRVASIVRPEPIDVRLCLAVAVDDHDDLAHEQACRDSA